MTTAVPVTTGEPTVTPVEPADLETGPEPAAVPRPSFPFLLSLTVVAVFPLAIGIGAAGLKGATSLTTGTAAIGHGEATDVAGRRPLPIRPADRQVGDDLLRAGRWEAALQYYRSLGSADSLRLPGELSFRIALCQEGLGLWDEALAGFRAIASAAESSPLTAAATLGQARIWMRLKQPAQAVPLLRSLVLGTHVPVRIVQEASFLVPLALTMEMTTTSEPAAHGGVVSRNDLMPVTDSIEWPWDTALEGIDPQRHHHEPPADASHATHQSSDLRCSTTGQRDRTEPSRLENWTVDGAACDQSLGAVLERLAAECGMRLDWRGDSRDAALGRVVNFSVEDLPVCSLLTVICGELHATWSTEDEMLTIARVAADHELSRTMLARTLDSLMGATPKHRLAGHARFARGRLAQADGDHALAVTQYSSLVGRASSPQAIRAAYNAGVSYCQLDDLPHACEQLTFVVHGAPGHELHTRSTILLGRLLLERDECREAVFQLQRASEARLPPEDQARASVFLGMAHLMQGQPRAAAEALFADKPHFQDRSVRNAAAFLTALARYRLLTGAQREREAAFLFRSLVTIESDAEWLGPTGQLLIGQALHELGLDDRMVELYATALDHHLPTQIANEMKFAMAEQRRAEQKPEEARSLWQELSTGGAGVWQNRARLRLAELCLAAGRADDCVAACRALHHADGVPRTNVLKLMGRAYEQLGHDALAAQCYAGQMPPP